MPENETQDKPTQGQETKDNGPDPEFIARELRRCAKSFPYFCRNYAYVIEPRPEVEEGDADEDADFHQFFEGISRRDELGEEALELLSGELADQEVSGSERHFELWDFQVEAAGWLRWLVERGKSGAIEKCRDMGMSWLVLWFILWCWLFRPRFSALLGSRKEAAVDNGKLSSLFGKLDYGIEKLPEWMKPKGYDRTKHRTKLSIVNPENGNYLVGDSQTPDFGRGERHTLVFLDEYAFWTFDVWGSLKHVTKTIIAGSTVNGENHFYRLTERLRAVSPRRVLRMEWWQNPYHTKEWYAQQEAENDEADFAREILIDYKASVRGKYYPICSIVPYNLKLKWEAGWPSFLSADFGVNDNTALIWWQKNPRPGPGEKQYRMLFSYTNSGKGIEFYLPFFKAEMPTAEVVVRDAMYNLVLDPTTKAPLMTKNPFVYSDKDLAFLTRLREAGVTYPLDYRGDPAGRQRSQDTAISVERKLYLNGIYMRSFTDKNEYRVRRSALGDVLTNSEVAEEAYDAFNAIRQAKFVERRENSRGTTVSEAPVHDWTSHFRSAAEYFAVGETPLETKTPPRSGTLVIRRANGI